MYMYRWVVALALAAFGHAAWDNVLHWMVQNDPDASILHMHWLRSAMLTICLWIVTKHQTLPHKSWWWWIQFALFGFTIPSLLYTLCLQWTGYRIILGGQPFIPLLVALYTKQKWNVSRCVALILAFCGTWSIWVSEPWTKRDDELWAVWFASIATAGHVLSIARWFSMMTDVRQQTLAATTRGAIINVVLMFLATIVWTPQHLQAAYMTRWDAWVFILIACAIASGCKYWVIAMAVETLQPDTVAIFECIHPIATLAVELIIANDVFEYSDMAALTCFIFGCILYPKTNI